MSIQPGDYPPTQYYQPVPAAPPPPPRRRRLVLWIAVGVAAVALVGGTIWGAIAESRPSGSAEDGSVFGSDPAQSEVTTGDTKVVTASDRKSQITVPASWKDVPESFRNELAVIQLGHLRREEYVAVITGTKTDFDDFSGFEEACIEEAQTALGNADVGERRSLTVGNLPAVQYNLTGRVSGLRVVFWITLIEGRNSFYEVMAWTLPSKQAQAEPTMLSVINSFREIEPA